MKQDYYEEYFSRIQDLQKALPENGNKFRHQAIHAGQALIYSMAREAQDDASESKKRSKRNREYLQVLGVLVIALLVLNVERIPELVDLILTVGG